MGVQGQMLQTLDLPNVTQFSQIKSELDALHIQIVCQKRNNLMITTILMIILHFLFTTEV